MPTTVLLIICVCRAMIPSETKAGCESETNPEVQVLEKIVEIPHVPTVKKIVQAQAPVSMETIAPAPFISMPAQPKVETEIGSTKLAKASPHAVQALIQDDAHARTEWFKFIKRYGNTRNPMLHSEDTLSEFLGSLSMT